MPKFKSPNDHPIVQVLETCPCAAGISEISKDGTEVTYDGTGSVMFWDNQVPIKEKGKLVFLDEVGDEWTFDELTEITDNE